MLPFFELVGDRAFDELSELPLREVTARKFSQAAKHRVGFRILSNSVDQQFAVACGSFGVTRGFFKRERRHAFGRFKRIEAGVKWKRVYWHET